MVEVVESASKLAKKNAWDTNTMGYGKHEFRKIDPETVNPEEFCKNMYGDQQHFGDVREENTAENSRHPENNLGLDWLGRIGTEFDTEAEGYQGKWQVTNMPVVKSPIVFARVTRVDDKGELMGDEVIISCIDLGIAVDDKNFFKQVKSTLTKKGAVDRTQRLKLTKRS